MELNSSWKSQIDEGLLHELNVLLRGYTWHSPSTEILENWKSALAKCFAVKDENEFWFHVGNYMQCHLFTEEGGVFPIKCGGNNFLKLNTDSEIIGTARLSEPLDAITNVSFDTDADSLVKMQVHKIDQRPANYSVTTDLPHCLLLLLKKEHDHLRKNMHEATIDEINYVERFHESEDEFLYEYESMQRTLSIYDKGKLEVSILNLFSFNTGSVIKFESPSGNFLVMPSEICVKRSSLYLVEYSGKEWVLRY